MTATLRFLLLASLLTTPARAEATAPPGEVMRNVGGFGGALVGIVGGARISSMLVKSMPGLMKSPLAPALVGGVVTLVTTYLAAKGLSMAGQQVDSWMGDNRVTRTLGTVTHPAVLGTAAGAAAGYRAGGLVGLLGGAGLGLLAGTILKDAFLARSPAATIVAREAPTRTEVTAAPAGIPEAIAPPIAGSDPLSGANELAITDRP